MPLAERLGHSQVLHAHVTEQHLAQALNCSLVGLASTKHTHTDLPMQGSTSVQPLLHCMGIGIVRGIDAEQGLLYLLTDLALQDLGDVDVLQVPQAAEQTSEISN